MIALVHILPLAREGVLLEPRPLEHAPAQVVRRVAALAAGPHAALVPPATEQDGARVLRVHGPRAVLVVARGRQAGLEVDGAARAKVPLHRVVPAGVVVRVCGAHFFPPPLFFSSFFFFPLLLLLLLPQDDSENFEEGFQQVRSAVFFSVNKMSPACCWIVARGTC